MRVKICGLTSAEALRAAAEAGADYVGLNFFPPSPRSVTLETAADLVQAVPPGVTTVALVVDADDALVEGIAALPVDMIQLHGTESPERVAEIRALSGLAVMKVIGIRDAGDLALIDAHAGADQLLIDAKPPKDAVLPGGNGLRFDWRLIAGRDWPVPWMLAGGLSAGNVADAIRLTGADQVDVASGVEHAPGDKDPALMAAFITAAKAASGP